MPDYPPIEADDDGHVPWDSRRVDAYVAGYMAAVHSTIGHLRQILSPTVWSDLEARTEERAVKEARHWATVTAEQ